MCGVPPTPELWGWISFWNWLAVASLNAAIWPNAGGRVILQSGEEKLVGGRKATGWTGLNMVEHWNPGGTLCTDCVCGCVFLLDVTLLWHGLSESSRLTFTPLDHCGVGKTPPPSALSLEASALLSALFSELVRAEPDIGALLGCWGGESSGLWL